MKNLLIALCLAMLFVGHAAAQSFTDLKQIPSTPACTRAAEIVALVNEGEPAKIREYVRKNFMPALRDAVPMEMHVEVAMRTHMSSRKLEIYGARQYDPARPETDAVFICRNTFDDSWMGIVVSVEAIEPYRIAGLQFNPARPPKDQPQEEPLTLQQAADALGAHVDRLAKAGLFSGTVILAKDGKPLLSRAAGIANRDFNAPVTIDTKFNLGSMNKMMTGLSIMQLVEKGKLSLDDPISKHLSEDWLPKVDKSKVKVVHLLTHTSGLGSYFNEKFDQSSRALFRRVDDWKPIVADETLAFEPGSRTSYSNTGMLIAGAVIEKVSGLSYDNYVRANITGPAGMNDTACYELDQVNPNLAVGYETAFGEGGKIDYRNNIFMHVIKGGPAGGGYSTAPDLLRFDQALRTGKLLKKESLEELWKARPEIASPNYGLGFGVSESPMGKVVGHSGGFNGISANLAMYLDSGYTIAVMSNLDDAAMSVNQKAAALLARVKK